MWRTVFLGLLLCVPARLASAGEEPVVYYEDFESGQPQWRIWTQNAENACTVNYVGPTSEKAFAGKRSLKLDLTFQAGSYCYWSGKPLKIPCAGDLKLSGYLYVEQLPPGVRLGLGYNVVFPPSGHSGCSTIETLTTPTRRWLRFELSLAPVGEQKASHLLGTTNVYCYMDRIAVMFTGTFKPGQHAVIYVDELKVTGHLPDDYEAGLREQVRKEHQSRMAEVRQWKEQIEQYARRLGQLQSQLAALPQPVRNHAQQVAEAARAEAGRFQTEAEQFVKRGRWMLRGEEQRWKEGLAVVGSGLDTLERLLSHPARYAGLRFVLYTRRAICDDRVLPNRLPVPAQIGDTIRLVATPGEFEPATFICFACDDLQQVQLEATPLHCGSAQIPAAAVDLRVVKVWYQNGISSIGFRKGQRILVPELLLKEPLNNRFF